LSKAKPRTIQVEIYDQCYSLVVQTSIEESEVRKLAEEIDGRMRLLASGANTADSLKLAILTALHLAQDHHDLQVKIDQKAGEWCRALDQVLKK